MKNLEMKELEIVTGGEEDMTYKEILANMAGISLKKKAFVNKPTAAFACEYDKEDTEYLEDILDPEDLYNCFAV